MANGRHGICRVSLEARHKTNKLKTKHLHTVSTTHLCKSQIHPQKGWAAAKPPPITFEDSYLICISAWVVSICQYVNGAILQYVNGGIGKDGKTQKITSNLATFQVELRYRRIPFVAASMWRCSAACLSLTQPT